MAVDARPAQAALPATRRLFDTWIRDGDLLGGQLSVGTGDRVVADLAAGCSEIGRPAAVTDTGRLYCTAKPLTTVCLARAVERGALGFEDPVSRFLPVRDDPRRRGLTVRSLLTHSAGFPGPRTPTYGSTFAEVVRGATLGEIPGWEWAPQPTYDTTSAWHILAAIVHVVFGEPADDVVRREIAEPLGLAGLTLTRPQHPQRYAPLYKRVGPHAFAPVPAVPPEDLFSRLNPAHGGVASARDLGAFQRELLRCLLGRGTLLTAATTAELVRPQVGVTMGPGLRTATWGTGLEVDLAADSMSGDWSRRTFGHRGAVPVRTVVLTFTDPVRGVAGAIRLFSVDARSNWRVWKLSSALSEDLRGAGC